MGCGESKHGAVAAAATIFRRKPSSKKAAAKEANGSGVAAAVDQARDPHVQDPPYEEVHHATDVANNENDVASTVVEVRDVKNDNEDVVNVVDDNKESGTNGQDRLGIDGMIADGRLGKSENSTPPRGSSAGSNNRTAEDGLIEADQIDNGIGGADEINDNVIVTGDQELAEGSDQSIIVPDRQDQTVEEKSENVEENVEKEELEVSVPAQEEDSTTTPNIADEKHVVDSPTKELETI